MESKHSSETQRLVLSSNFEWVYPCFYIWRTIVKCPRILSLQFVVLYKPCKHKPRNHSVKMISPVQPVGGIVGRRDPLINWCETVWVRKIPWSNGRSHYGLWRPAGICVVGGEIHRPTDRTHWGSPDQMLRVNVNKAAPRENIQEPLWIGYIHEPAEKSLCG